MREIRLSGSEGGGANSSPYPYIPAQGCCNPGITVLDLLANSEGVSEAWCALANAFSVTIR
jgi:hypothetical protein